jgi:hypothetical protein
MPRFSLNGSWSGHTIPPRAGRVNALSRQEESVSSLDARPLDRIDGFIALAHELAKLPAMANPQYAPAAVDLHEISKKLLIANENMARWLNAFLYLDFRAADARSAFLQLVRDYRTAKTGPRFKELKYSCGDISLIYGRQIAGNLGGWLGRGAKEQDAQRVFVELGNADDDMVAFIHDRLTGALDEFVKEVEPLVDAGRLDDAEAARLRFKVQCSDVSEKLERFGSGLSDLVLEFARLAGRPVTLA